MKTLFPILLISFLVQGLYGELPGKLQEGLLFHLDFDDTLSAAVAGGAADVVKVPEQIEFQEGVKGRAVVLGDPSARRLQYRHDGNLDMAQGTISFWVKPMDWGERDALLFQMGISTEGYFGLQVIGSSGKMPRLMFFSQNFHVQERENESIWGDSEWNDDRWRHVLLTWSENTVKLYTDRGLAGEATLSKPYESGEITWSYFYLGGSKTRTVMDEFRIWNRALSEEEIINLQQAEEPKQ